MTPEDYRMKYGDARVMGVDRSIVIPYLKDGFTHRRNTVLVEGHEAISLSACVERRSLRGGPAPSAVEDSIQRGRQWMTLHSEG